MTQTERVAAVQGINDALREAHQRHETEIGRLCDAREQLMVSPACNHTGADGKDARYRVDRILLCPYCDLGEE